MRLARMRVSWPIYLDLLSQVTAGVQSLALPQSYLACLAIIEVAISRARVGKRTKCKNSDEGEDEDPSERCRASRAVAFVYFVNACVTRHVYATRHRRFALLFCVFRQAKCKSPRKNRSTLSSAPELQKWDVECVLLSARVRAGIRVNLHVKKDTSSFALVRNIIEEGTLVLSRYRDIPLYPLYPSIKSRPRRPACRICYLT